MMLLSTRGVAAGETAATAVETWSFSTKWMPVDGSDDPPQAVMDNLVGHCLERAAELFDGSGMVINNNVWLTECRLYLYGNFYGQPSNSAGRFGWGTARRIAYSDPDFTPKAGDGVIRAPLQCSTVVTLDTAGRTNPRFGRFYLPGREAIPGMDNRLTESNANGVLADVATYLENVNDHFSQDTSQDWELSVVQSTFISPGAALKTKPVRGLRVGRVIDTQRRRRNQVEEAYVGQDYP